MPLLGKGPQKSRGGVIRYAVGTDAVSPDEACVVGPGNSDFKVPSGQHCPLLQQ